MNTATKKEENKVIEVKPEVREMASRIQKDMKIDSKTGIATVSADLYEKLLPETINKEQIVALQNHNTIFAAASGLAVAEDAVSIMKKHKDVERVSLSMPMIGKDTAEVIFDRSRTVPDRDNPGQTKQKMGSLSVSFDIYGAGARGELKKVKQLMSEAAQKALQ